MLVQFQRQKDLAFILLAKSLVQKNPVALKELLTCSLATVPHCLGTPDGFFGAKASKVSLPPFLMRDKFQEVKYPTESMHYFTPLLAWLTPFFVDVVQMCTTCVESNGPPTPPSPPPQKKLQIFYQFILWGFNQRPGESTKKNWRPTYTWWSCYQNTK